MTGVVGDGPARAMVALFLLAGVVLVVPYPPWVRRRGRVPARTGLHGPRRALVAGAGVACAGLLLAPAWWPLVVTVAIGTGLIVGRQRPGSGPDPAASALGDLAVRLDLIAACLRSGLGVGAALAAAESVSPVDARAGRPGDPASALHRAGLLLALGAEPAVAWRPAEACSELAPVAAAATRTAVGGTMLVSALGEQSAVLRARLAGLGAQRAGRAGVLIAAPLGLCFLPSFLCLGLAPVMIGLLGVLQMP